MPVLGSMGSVGGVTLLTLAAYLLATLIMSRSFTRSEFGYMNLWINSLNLIAIASLVGFPNALLRHVPRQELERSDWPRLGRALTGVGAGVALAGTLLYHVLYSHRVLDTLCLGVAALVLGQSLFPVTVLQILRRFAVAQLLNTLWRPGMLVGVLALAAWGALTPSAVFAVVVAAVVMGRGLLAWVLRRSPRGAAPIGIRGLTPDALVFASLYVSAVLVSRLDAFALPRMLGLDPMGTYSTLVFVSLTGFTVAGLAVGQVLNPLLASGDRVPWGRLTTLIVVAGGAGAVVLALLADWGVPLVFGELYRGEHTRVVLVLGAAGVLQVLYALPSSRIGIQASTRVLRGFVGLSLTSLAVDAVLLVWLVPRHGLLGAATATALTWVWRTGGAWAVAAWTLRGAEREPEPTVASG